MITQEELKNILKYNEETGIFTWIVPRANNRIKVGDIITCKDSDGYIITNIDKKGYKLHRLAFLYMEGLLPKQVDHINNIRSDNRWCNLRKVSNSQNQWNRSRNKISNLGVKGLIFIDDKYPRYLARIKTNGETRSKSFSIASKTKEEALNSAMVWLEDNRKLLHMEYKSNG